MIAIKYLALCLIVCTYYTNSNVSNGKSINTIIRKRAISQVLEIEIYSYVSFR